MSRYSRSGSRAEAPPAQKELDQEVPPAAPERTAAAQPMPGADLDQVRRAEILFSRRRPIRVIRSSQA